jgi:hypothetical protein
MTLSAILTKLVLVYIGMAIDAALKFQSCKYLERLTIPGFFPVTLNTIHLIMLPGKTITGIGVVKFSCRAEYILVMTGRACTG